ncbi:hypothetical protein EYC80_006106 [Monilinia laxa]|uniref:Thioredoxin domain-containing protein n=1 Tax=Monilinia laxa TaxID=61186 RepID=A0A5N6KG51_MONLA|nr:hypothetical protein EYC80_006106 [Monilinia laxa]
MGLSSFPQHYSIERLTQLFLLDKLIKSLHRSFPPPPFIPSNLDSNLVLSILSFKYTQSNSNQPLNRNTYSKWLKREQLRNLRLGSIAPNFQAETTAGPIDFHEFIGDKWVVLFSLTQRTTLPFAPLNSLIGLSANTIESHGGWIKDIDEISGSKLTFPIIGDKERKVAYAYDMLDHQDITNVDSKGVAFTIRSVFIIDPKKTIRLILSYPASTGRNTAEVLRVVDSLQTGDKHRITTPINWVPGDDVIVHPSVKNEEAKTLFPDFRIVKPYLRFTPLPKEKTSANV